MTAQTLPIVLGVPWAGVLADRPGKRRRVLHGHALMAVVAAALCSLTLSGAVTVPVVLGLAFARGRS